MVVQRPWKSSDIYGYLPLRRSFQTFAYPKAKFSKKTIIFGIAVLAAIAAVAFKYAPSYVQARLHTNIWADKTGDVGYQQCQALIAIAKGGWLGVGPGHGSLYTVRI